MSGDMDPLARPKRAGSVRRIKVENFMCHSNLVIELGERVNFITGRNGSGKSAILTALCVAFGIKAKGTQRANTVKDFVKNGCRHGLVVVELNNEGDEAFKPEIFGDTIIVERRILESSSTFTLKNSRGKKVASRKEDVLEVVDYFNIEVDNPCVIMTQDKSREFLHGGGDKEKFKFFFKATLLQQVHDLLTEWEMKLQSGSDEARVQEEALLPQKQELKQIEDQLKTLERREAFRQETEVKERIYAWLDVKEKKAARVSSEEELERLKTRRPQCQKKIDDAQVKVDQTRQARADKQAFIAKITHDTQELRQLQSKLDEAIREATREKVQAEAQQARIERGLRDTKDRLRKFENDLHEMHQEMLNNSQAERDEELDQIESQKAKRVRLEEKCESLREEEGLLKSKADEWNQAIQDLNKEIEEAKGRLRRLETNMQDLRSRQSHTVTAFGGNSILNLLRGIEENRHRFTRPPLGPIGAHLGLLEKPEQWSLAVEVAIGGMFNNFVVTNHRDGLLLRDLANRAGYRNVNYNIYDFDRPPIRPTANDLPDSSLLTIKGALHFDNTTIMNVLIDEGQIERRVLAEDYDTGKWVAFGGHRNVKDVVTKDGTRMFFRSGGETVLPPPRDRSGRLGADISEQLQEYQADQVKLNTSVGEAETRKRRMLTDPQRTQGGGDLAKRRRIECERDLNRLNFHLRDLQNAYDSKLKEDKESSMIELEQVIESTKEQVESEEGLLQESELKSVETKRKFEAAKAQVEHLQDSAREDLEASEEAEKDLEKLTDDLADYIAVVDHWKEMMDKRVEGAIQRQQETIEKAIQALEKCRAEAIEICPESQRPPETDNYHMTREQLSAHLVRAHARLSGQDDSSEPSEQLIKRATKMRKKLAIKETEASDTRQKFEILKEAAVERRKLYRRNCLNLRRELTWGFNENLRKKGFSGNVIVDYHNNTLNMSVQMPQDDSNQAVKDTRALSGGERSYSTLAFTLAVHKMTEAPFRAMDEFDVFMDAVSRKISLNTVVDFAVNEGSQWIFITPHDISMVKGSEYVKKQEMEAPRA